MTQLFGQRVGDFFLGADKRQRVRATQVLLALLLDVILAAVASFGVWAGVLALSHVVLWVVLTLAGVLCFYVAVRSGFNLRFKDDPALTFQQGVFSVLSTVGAYVMCGPVRGASLLALAVTLIFGMFALKPSQVRLLSLIAVLLLGLTMAYCNARWPARFPVAEEILHFMMVAAVFPSIAVLAGQLSTMRHKMRQHRDQLALALENNRQLAIRDELTGLYNRRHLLEVMKLESQRAERSGLPLCFALIDIDHFKRINDNHGHSDGDEVLRAFAQSALRALRETDTLGRWGGEEFLLMLPDTPVADAEGVIERVRQQLAQVRFDAIDPRLSVTFSAGIAAHAVSEAVMTTVEHADQAMYAAKQAGRNCSVVAGAGAEAESHAMMPA